MVNSVLAAVRVGPSKTEIREYPMPDVPDDAALMKMEVAGICGTDVKLYKTPPTKSPVIMGHENIGIIAKAGREFTRRKGFKEGDLVFVEHYVACGKCEWCHLGQYRHCENTDWRRNPDAIRYGYTSAEKAPHLWGGFAHYVYLPWNAVVHHVPKGVTPELAGLVTPMANGVEWSLFDGGVGYNSTVLIQGPGQQGLSQTVICKQAGAALIIVTGTSKDRARMAVAKELGADFTIDVEKEDPLACIMEITAGKGVDVALDCTAGAGTIPILLGVEALKRKGGTIVVGDARRIARGNGNSRFIAHAWTPVLYIGGTERLRERPVHSHGKSEAWITSGTPWPPTDLMARSTSLSPNLWVVTFSNGKRFEASCARASSHALKL